MLGNLQDITQVFTITDMVLTIGLSFVLSAVIAWVYKSTYHGMAYSQSYVHTLIMMSMIVAVIMLVIGSNIARAFSLVGALSIIRFRNAMKDTRDVGFIFFAIAIGMACGTGFYLLAVVSTLAISALMFQLTGMNLFAADGREQVLRFRVADGIDYETAFLSLFNRYLERYKLISVKIGQNDSVRLVYLVKFREDINPKAFLSDLHRLNGHQAVSLINEADENGF
ncbi:MAG: DUF4956 domain-containing protein [Chloroflexi bacterium]|nr:MAG: DUF4956 domain-containing protein [Chloroflexota bacterium]